MKLFLAAPCSGLPSALTAWLSPGCAAAVPTAQQLINAVTITSAADAAAMSDPGTLPILHGDSSTHLRTVRLPYDPLSTKRRQPGILVHVHPVLRESLKPRNSSFVGQDRMDNLMKAHS